MTSEQVKAFWSCFLENEEKIYRLGRLPNGEGADDIDKIISPKMKDNMGFETGPINDADGKSLGLSHPISEFCILVHGSGHKTNFNAVLALEKTAPTHLGHRWKFTFFRPRLPFIPFVTPALDDKELNNGRLAMIAAAGFLAQEAINGQGILENLGF